ncbi:hypothetical protein A7U60_g1582 [Sanghuangporus baumii]|uniref:Nucleosome assembly protein n=1 Tax=Sanghuangporus baumii TaxID=108892 RepID=A0A9Q5NEK8_SANBA|nr:hypothetical protein A7U60_g1582 [Sanghuangporus baumii]
MSGKKRPASPVGDDVKNLFDVEISDGVQKKLEDISADVLRAELITELGSVKRMEPIYEKRREIVKAIPKFWAVALVNHPEFAPHVQHPDDQKAIATLEDLWVIRDPAEPRAFSIEFYFGENPYFSNKVLKKVYKYTPPPAAKDEKPDDDGITPSMLDFDWTRDIEPQKTLINWKSNVVNLTKLQPRVVDDDGDVADAGSFFNYFEREEDPLDIGLLITQSIYPEAINLFTGKYERNLLDEYSEEDEEDEDEAEEIDLEKPEPKKQRKH